MAKKTDADKVLKYVNILRRTDIFYDLTEPQLEMVASLCSEVTPKAGEIIFEENSTGDELYVIASGEVDILVDPALVQPVTTGRPSRPLTIATLRRGQTFGEIALVDQGLRSASARCASKKARLLVIPRDRLIKLCDTYPDLGYRLMRNIAADLAFKIRGTDLMIREQLLWHPRPTRGIPQ
ncbi:MAG: cyclic nucleotide-binding domain-containing protein [Chloroflexi bacterium]|nr:MAG: cyclic nucleotide-binding domain-containing protein [Chloroflexota bacterium]